MVVLVLGYALIYIATDYSLDRDIDVDEFLAIQS